MKRNFTGRVFEAEGNVGGLLGGSRVISPGGDGFRDIKADAGTVTTFRQKAAAIVADLSLTDDQLRSQLQSLLDDDTSSEALESYLAPRRMGPMSSAQKRFARRGSMTAAFRGE